MPDLFVAEEDIDGDGEVTSAIRGISRLLYIPEMVVRHEAKVHMRARSARLSPTF